MVDDLILFCHDKEDEYFAKGMFNWLSSLGIGNVQNFKPDLLQDSTVVIALMPITGTQISELIENLKLANRQGKATIGVLLPEASKPNLTTISPYIDYLASETIYSNITESLSRHLAQFFKIPPEVFTLHGRLPAYQKAISQSASRPLKETKLIVVGQGSVGKTSLINRILEKKYNPDESMTGGIAINHWAVRVSNNQDLEVGDDGLISLPHANRDLKVIEDETIIVDSEVGIRVNIWDFGGQEIMHATHQFFLTKRCIYLLVLDARLSQEDNRVEYWLKIIQSLGGESPVIIAGNKIDQHSLDLDRTGLRKKYPNIVGILEVSAATNKGIPDLILVIKQQMGQLPHIWDLLPENWFTIKLKLEELGKEKNFITQDQYLALCDTNEVTAETSKHALIGFLHDLGVVLHFQDDLRLEPLGILNPQWVTNGVYKIINSQTLFKSKGMLTMSMVDKILDLPEYPRGKRLFIMDIMRKFELCYDIDNETFLVPDLLPKDEPVELQFTGIPAFEYTYTFLPSSIVTRFIVRMNQHIHNNFAWRTGVILEIGENIALVKADLEERKITIAIDGLEHTRRDALSAIRYQLDEIHGSIKGLNPEKYVPVPGAPDADPLEYETLLMMEREGIETTHVKSGRKLVAVNVSQMLNGVESEYQRKQYGNVINISGNVTGGIIIAGDENEVKK